MSQSSAFSARSAYTGAAWATPRGTALLGRASRSALVAMIVLLVSARTFLDHPSAVKAQGEAKLGPGGHAGQIAPGSQICHKLLPQFQANDSFGGSTGCLLRNRHIRHSPAPFGLRRRPHRSPATRS